MALFIVPISSESSVFAAVEQAQSRPAAPLAALPTLTNLAIADPYLAQQLDHLRQQFELQPPTAGSLRSRLRARLAWWLLGPEIAQRNQTHAAIVRILDSLTVQLDHERAARRRIEEHLAALGESPTAALPAPPLEQPAPATALVWHSSFATPTGYSGSSRAFVLGLAAAGVPVRPLYLYGTDRDEHITAGQMHPRILQLQQVPVRLDVPQVVYAPGDRFHKNSGSYRIGFTMLEGDRLPAAWVAQANQMHEVWTPTEWGAQVFRASGIQRPIHVVPLGVDTARFCPGPPRPQMPERTVFLSVFEWGMRKGWDILLRAYRAAFRADDTVLLLLKVDCRAPAVNPLREMLRLLPEPAPPVGVIYNATLTPAQLAELYKGSDCFVLPTHGEGWGMPILEAMACGVPAIATAWSGPTAFLNAANGYPLPLRGLEPTGIDEPYYREARWAAPDEAALVELLRHVAAHPEERRRKGQQAAQDAQQWTWASAVARVRARVGL